LLPFLGEARKGSRRRSTTGQQSHSYDRNINKTKPQKTKNSMPPTRIFHAPRRQECLKKRMEYAQWLCAVALPVLKFYAAQAMKSYTPYLVVLIAASWHGAPYACLTTHNYMSNY
jgi:hypothetical protein